MKQHRQQPFAYQLVFVMIVLLVLPASSAFADVQRYVDSCNDRWQTCRSQCTTDRYDTPRKRSKCGKACEINKAECLQNAYTEVADTNLRA